MTRSTLTLAAASLLAGGVLTTFAPTSIAARADNVRSASVANATALSSATLAHCEIPCGIFDDHMMVQEMLLDAETIRKASAQLVELEGKLGETEGAMARAQIQNTMMRWVIVKEEHSRELQHMNAWYFMTQRVKAVPKGDRGYADYLERLAAHHEISVAAMKAMQSLDPAAQARLTAAIKVVEPWYPPKDAGANADEEQETWTRVAERNRP